VAPFACLTRKDQPFSCVVEVDNVFQILKDSFTTTPLLTHINPSKHFFLEMHTSNFVINVVLSQLGETFHCDKVSPRELNYEIDDKKLLTIVDAFEQYCHLLEKVQHEIIVISNDTTFLCQIHEDLKKNPFVIGI